MGFFDPSLVYPIDENGRFVSLEGKVVAVAEQSEPEDEVRVDVRTPDGEFYGFTCRPPKVGYTATIQVYDCGGGHYSDSRIVGWTSPRSL